MRYVLYRVPNSLFLDLGSIGCHLHCGHPAEKPPESNRFPDSHTFRNPFSLIGSCLVFHHGRRLQTVQGVCDFENPGKSQRYDLKKSLFGRSYLHLGLVLAHKHPDTQVVKHYGNTYVAFVFLFAYFRKILVIRML